MFDSGHHQGLDDDGGGHPHGRGEQVGKTGPHHGGPNGVGRGQQGGGEIDQRVAEVDIAARGPDGHMEEKGGHDGDGGGQNGGGDQRLQLGLGAHGKDLLGNFCIQNTTN